MQLRLYVWQPPRRARIDQFLFTAPGWDWFTAPDWQWPASGAERRRPRFSLWPPTTPSSAYRPAERGANPPPHPGAETIDMMGRTPVTTENPFVDDPEQAEIFEIGYLQGFQDPSDDSLPPLAPELVDVFIQGV